MNNPPPSQTSKQKCSQGRSEGLKNAFCDLIVEIYTAAAYHNRRSFFFQRWHFILLILDWIGGALIAFWGFLLTVKRNEKSSVFENLYIDLGNAPIFLAILAIFLLFINFLFDFSKKFEKHRWLTASYINLKKEISLTHFVTWNELDDGKYEERKKKYWEIQARIKNLIKEEYPMLKFLKLVSYYEGLQKLSEKKPLNKSDTNSNSINDLINADNNDTIDTAFKAISKIGCLVNIFINILSMPLCAMKFEQRMRDSDP